MRAETVVFRLEINPSSCSDETGCVAAPAELGTQSGWSSTPTSSVVLYSLGFLLLLLILLGAGYKVSRQRVVSLHQDQSQSQSVR